MQLSSREQDMLEKHLKGLSYQQIADQYDYTDTWVRAIIRKAKLKAKAIQQEERKSTMTIEEIEIQNGVKIEARDGLYYVYNHFGRLVFIASTIESIETGLKEDVR